MQAPVQSRSGSSVQQSIPVSPSPPLEATDEPALGVQRRTQYYLNRIPASVRGAGTVEAKEVIHPAPSCCRSFSEIFAERKANKAAAKNFTPRKRSSRTEKIQESTPSWKVSEAELQSALMATALRDAQAQTRVQVKRSVERLALPVLSDLLNLTDFRPKRGKGAGTAGAGALAELLDSCARTALATRLHLYDQNGRPPKQVVLHLPAEMLAKALGITENTLREWTGQLQRAGYLYAHRHHTTTTQEGKRITAVDGMLYAVRLSPEHEARLRFPDYKRQYRNLDADRAAKRTAYNAIRNAERRAQEDASEGETIIEGSVIPTAQVRAELHKQLHRWAVIPGNVSLENPLNIDPSIITPEEVAKQLNGVQDVAYMLRTLKDAHPSKRTPLVGILASVLAHSLNDQMSQDFYCKIIWEAWQEEVEGRNGLQNLEAQLLRLEVDCREWKELRNPAALLVARLRPAA